MPIPTIKQLAQTPHVRTLAGMAGAPLDAAAGLAFSLNFTANTHKVQAGVPSGMPTGGSARTLAAWIKPTAISTGPGILQLRASAGQSYCLSSTNASNGICFTDSVNGNNNFILAANQQPPIGAWSFVCLTFDGATTLAYYTNGLLTTTKTTGTAINTGALTAVSIGLRLDSPQPFNGLVAAPRIWNRALSVAEIVAAYQNQPPVRGLVGEWLFAEGGGLIVQDTSGNSNTGTITGATWSSDVPQF